MIGLERPDTLAVRPTVGDLRRVRDMLLSASDTSARSVARALGQILDGVDARQALGLKGRAGQRSVFTTERLAQRDALICQIADRHFQHHSISDQARMIAGVAAAYRRRAARLDLALDAMPGSYTGTPREYLFRLSRLPAEMPQERTIRAILSTDRSCTLDNRG